MREAWAGAGYLGRGFAFLRRRPGLYALGVLPAFAVFVALLVAFVALVWNIDGVVAWATPFADGWSDAVRGVVRFLLAIAVLVGALVLATMTFVGLTLAVGEPCYARIWREVERSLGGPVPDDEPGLVRAAVDGVALAAVGAAAGLVVFVLGFLPVIGTVVGAVLGVVVAGRFLGLELVARPLEARGLDRHARAALLRPHRSRVLGFGVATQVTFLVPLAAVLVMPAAVAGAAFLGRELWETSGPAAPPLG